MVILPYNKMYRDSRSGKQVRDNSMKQFNIQLHPSLHMGRVRPW